VVIRHRLLIRVRDIELGRSVWKDFAESMPPVTMASSGPVLETAKD
jgi:hypothetical protein